MVTFTYKTPFAHLPLYDLEDRERMVGLWQQYLLHLMRQAMANTTFVKPLEIPGCGTEANDR